MSRKLRFCFLFVFDPLAVVGLIEEKVSETI